MSAMTFQCEASKAILVPSPVGLEDYLWKVTHLENWTKNETNREGSPSLPMREA